MTSAASARKAIGRDTDAGTTTLERVERFWTRVIDWPGRSAHCTRRWSAASWCSG